MKRAAIQWLPAPEPHNFPAALSYLSLIFPVATAKRIVARLKRAPHAEFKAKDIFRSSGLSL
ncbi:MAG TPA: hypothetical protein VL241_08965, partial [Gemmatimonadales bacterium]|nr:hypothetical protein [Gemmatimonadales bacterium]